MKTVFTTLAILTLVLVFEPRFIQPINAAATAPSPLLIPVLPTSPPMVVVVRHNMNVRGGPGTNYPVIGSAAPGETFTLIGRNADSSWVQVDFSGEAEQAWLYAGLVEITGQVSLVPVSLLDTLSQVGAGAAVGVETRPTGTIYFVANTVENVAYLDLTAGGPIYINTDAAKSGAFQINPDGAELRQLRPSFANDDHLQISPDGQKILYPVDEGREIYLANRDDSNPINLTNTSELSEENPVWSPDGQRIAYIQSYDAFKRLPSRDNFTDVYVIKADGTTPINLTHNPPGVNATSITISPAGQRLAFVSVPWPNSMGEFGSPPPEHPAPDAPQDVYVIDLDGTNRINVSHNPANFKSSSPVWTPDSQRLLFLSGPTRNFMEVYDVYVANADGTNLINLTNTPALAEGEPRWSPDGQRLAFTCQVREMTAEASHWRANWNTGGLQFSNADGTGLTPCVDISPYPAVKLVWSPDGQQVAFIGEYIDLDKLESVSSPQVALFTLDANGSNLTRITDLAMQSSYGVAWSPAGQWLAFSATSSAIAGGIFTSPEAVRATMEHAVYRAKADGSQLMQLTVGEFGYISQIEWR